MRHLIASILLAMVTAQGLQAQLHLAPLDATIKNGDHELAPSADRDRIRFWRTTEAWPVWTVKASAPTKVRMMVSAANYNEAGATYEVVIGDFVNTGTVEDTGSWDKKIRTDMGWLTIPAGTHELSLRALTKPGRAVMDCYGIYLIGKTESLEVVPPDPNAPPKKQRSPYEGKPGFQANLESLHPTLKSFDITPGDTPLKVGAVAFGPDGTLYVSVWDYTGAVYAIQGYKSNDPEKIEIRRVAQGLAEPLGMCFVGDRLFVGQKQELTELIDRDGDGIFDEYRCISDQWPVSANFHQFTFGPVAHEGKLILNLAVAIEPGGATSVPQSKDRGCCIAVDPETGEYEIIAAGLRTPNGITVTKAGEILVNDNQGDYLPGSKLVHIEPGRFFNHKYEPLHEWASREVTPPVVWQPQNEIGNSPTEPIELPESWGPYAGQILHGDIRHGGLKRVFMEKIDGDLQGALFRFSQGLRGGTNRLAFGPDDRLYVGVAGNQGNWGRDAFTGLQALEFKGEVPFEMRAVRAKSEGVDIEFTQPLAKGQGWDPAYYRIDTWRYEPTAQYGGPKIDHRRMLIQNVSVSEDRKRVSLQLDGMTPENLVHIVLHQELKSDSGEGIFAGECWYTLNRIPKEAPMEFLPAPDGYTKLGKIEEVELSKGEQIHKTYCFVCHSTDGTRLVGPSFQGMLGRKQKVWADGEVSDVEVDREYIKRGVIDPPAEFPDSYQPVMPATLHEAIGREDLEKLIDWITEQ